MKKILIIIVPFLMTASCVSPALMPVWNAYEARDGKTLIVGKITVDPPLTEKGRNIRALGSDAISWDTIWMICGGNMRKVDRTTLSPDSDEFKEKIDAHQGEAFYYACADRPFYFIAGSFYKNIYRMSTSRGISGEYDAVLLPGGFYIDIKPGDKAIYIGTIRYYRDDSFNIKKVEIIDEYDREMPMFRRMFGAIKLRKALIKQP